MQQNVKSPLHLFRNNMDRRIMTWVGLNIWAGLAEVEAQARLYRVTRVAGHTGLVD